MLYVSYTDTIIVPPYRPATSWRVFAYGVIPVDLFLGDVLDPAVRDPLRKAFGLPPWSAVRNTLTLPPPAPDDFVRCVHPIEPPPGMTRDDYVQLMEEPARGKLGSAV